MELIKNNIEIPIAIAIFFLIIGPAFIFDGFRSLKKKKFVAYGAPNWWMPLIGWMEVTKLKEYKGSEARRVALINIGIGFLLLILGSLIMFLAFINGMLAEIKL